MRGNLYFPQTQALNERLTGVRWQEPTPGFRYCLAEELRRDSPAAIACGWNFASVLEGGTQNHDTSARDYPFVITCQGGKQEIREK